MTKLKLLFTLIVIIGILGCKSKLNQMVNKQREGKWITIDTLDSIYNTNGKYSKGKEIGTWKYFYNGRLVQKEKYHKSICNTTFYYPNGKIMKKGNTKSESNEKEDHWYYLGKWYFYDKTGKLDSTKTYKKEDTTNQIKVPQ
jgi:antitoxin component YwqK of YwqJK toxin-antitoxin module